MILGDEGASNGSWLNAHPLCGEVFEMSKKALIHWSLHLEGHSLFFHFTGSAPFISVAEMRQALAGLRGMGES